MNRRQAIGLGLATAVAIPAGWVLWNRSKLSESATSFSKDQLSILENTVDAIIPEGVHPGAKKLGVHLLVAKLIQDCYDKETLQQFKSGLEDLNSKAKNKHSKDFSSILNTEKIEILKSYPKDDAFISLLRNLTIQGYKTSEYFMTEIQKFEFVPGRYHGCVNLEINA